MNLSNSTIKQFLRKAAVNLLLSTKDDGKPDFALHMGKHLGVNEFNLQIVSVPDNCDEIIVSDSRSSVPAVLGEQAMRTLLQFIEKRALSDVDDLIGRTLKVRKATLKLHLTAAQVFDNQKLTLKLHIEQLQVASTVMDTEDVLRPVFRAQPLSLLHDRTLSELARFKWLQACKYQLNKRLTDDFDLFDDVSNQVVELDLLNSRQFALTEFQDKDDSWMSLTEEPAASQMCNSSVLGALKNQQSKAQNQQKKNAFKFAHKSYVFVELQSEIDADANLSDLLAKEKDDLAEMLLMDYPVSAKITASSNVLDEQPDLLDSFNSKPVAPVTDEQMTSEQKLAERIGFGSEFAFDRKLLVKDRPMTVQGYREYLRWVDLHKVVQEPDQQQPSKEAGLASSRLKDLARQREERRRKDTDMKEVKPEAAPVDQKKDIASIAAIAKQTYHKQPSAQKMTSAAKAHQENVSTNIPQIDTSVDAKEQVRAADTAKEDVLISDEPLAAARKEVPQAQKDARKKKKHKKNATFI